MHALVCVFVECLCVMKRLCEHCQPDPSRDVSTWEFLEGPSRTRVPARGAGGGRRALRARETILRPESWQLPGEGSVKLKHST